MLCLPRPQQAVLSSFALVRKCAALTHTLVLMYIRRNIVVRPLIGHFCETAHPCFFWYFANPRRHPSETTGRLRSQGRRQRFVRGRGFGAGGRSYGRRHQQKSEGKGQGTAGAYVAVGGCCNVGSLCVSSGVLVGVGPGVGVRPRRRRQEVGHSRLTQS